MAWLPAVVLTSACSVLSLDGLTRGDNAGAGATGGAEPECTDGAAGSSSADSSTAPSQGDAAGNPGAPGIDSSTGDASSDGSQSADAPEAEVPPEASGADAGSPPPIAFVQAAAGGATKETTASVTFANAISSHDAVIVAIGIGNGATVTQVSDSIGNDYQIVVGPTTEGPGVLASYIAFAGDVAGGADTVVVKVSGSGYLDVYIHEYSGLALSNAFDVGSGATGTSTATNGVSSGSATTDAGNELIFGFGNASGTLTVGTGFTARSTFDGNLTEDMIAVTAGSYQATATASTDEWGMIMGAFHGQ